MIARLKENLAQAQARMKKYADLKRSERKFNLGDMVYLRLQLFRHNAFGIHQNLKLATKYYGPFKIMELIGPSAYRLQLPPSTDIHLVFHVSQLKNMLGLGLFLNRIRHWSLQKGISRLILFKC
jgi:hypothetical protein